MDKLNIIIKKTSKRDERLVYIKNGLVWFGLWIKQNFINRKNIGTMRILQYLVYIKELKHHVLLIVFTLKI